MLVYYMYRDKTQWRRSSLRLGEYEYQALVDICQRLNMSPTSFVESCKVRYKKEESNFTSYVKNEVVKQLLKEKSNDNNATNG